MSQRRRIDLITRIGLGLGRDKRLLAEILNRLDFQVDVHTVRRRYLDGLPALWGQRFIRRLTGTPAPLLNLFIEHLIPGWFSQARYNWFIPNQEWLTTSTLAHLDRVDLALCKSHYAESLFARYATPTAYIGFTSDDRYRAPVQRNYRQFFHMAGSTAQKGTRFLLDLWEQHPEWPTLTVSYQGELARPPSARNIRLLRHHLSEETLLTLQNQHGIHLCPSLAEGFGHSIVEAMSCQAVVVATDAPPMNELVTGERGLLFGYERSEPQGLGERFLPDMAEMAVCIERLLGMDEAEKQRLGEAARVWYLDNDRAFRERLTALIRTL